MPPGLSTRNTSPIAFSGDRTCCRTPIKKTQSADSEGICGIFCASATISTPGPGWISMHVILEPRGGAPKYPARAFLAPTSYITGLDGNNSKGEGLSGSAKLVEG